jgi:hypothetical protein
MGDELDTMLEELLKQGLREVASVAEELAKERLSHSGDRLAVIDVARREPNR